MSGIGLPLRPAALYNSTHKVKRRHSLKCIKAGTAGTRQGARPDGEEKKIFDATNFQSHYTLQRVAALYFMCALYSAAGRRGNPMPDNLTLVSGQ